MGLVGCCPRPPGPNADEIDPGRNADLELYSLRAMRAQTAPTLKLILTRSGHGPPLTPSGGKPGDVDDERALHRQCVAACGHEPILLSEPSP